MDDIRIQYLFVLECNSVECACNDFINNADPSDCENILYAWGKAADDIVDVRLHNFVNTHQMSKHDIDIARKERDKIIKSKIEYAKKRIELFPNNANYESAIASCDLYKVIGGQPCPW